MDEVVNYFEDTIGQLMSELNELTRKLDVMREELLNTKNENASLKEIIEAYKEWDHV